MAVGEGYRIFGAPFIPFIWLTSLGVEYLECSEPWGDVPRSEPVSETGKPFAWEMV